MSHWIIKELFKLLNDTSSKIEDCRITPENFSHLINLITRGEIIESIGRTVLEEMFGTGEDPESIIEEKGLRPLSDMGLLGDIINEVVGENPGVVDKISAGESKPIDFLIGQVMKKTRGKADAKVVKDLIRQKLLP